MTCGLLPPALAVIAAIGGGGAGRDRSRGRSSNWIEITGSSSGAFVAKGEPLFDVFGTVGTLDERELHHAVALGPERTMEQDPAFAYRILVDVAAKALSPALNDPTTAVLGVPGGS